VAIRTINGYKLGRLRRPSSSQIFYRSIRSPHGDYADYQERNQGKQQVSDTFEHMVRLFV